MMYNQNQYNQSLYNVQLVNLVCSESILQIENKPFDIEQFLIEFVFITPDLRMDVANKGISDIIRVNDWLALKKLFVEEWHD